MSFADLAQRIRLDEDSTLECRQLLLRGSTVAHPRRHDFADELAAMANGQGGTVVLGIDDRSHEIRGIPYDRLDAVQAWVQEICNDSIEPPLDAEIRKGELPGVTGQQVALLKIDIDRSLFVHQSPGGYCRRIGRVRRGMSPAVLARLFQERRQTRMIWFDELVAAGTSLHDLSEALVRRCLPRGTELTEDTLYKLGVIADDRDGGTGITVAGILMCTQTPERWLPHARIQAASYAGEHPDVNYQMDARDIAGPLDDQIFEAMHFLRRNMSVAATKPAGRTEHPPFSERAVLEALVNAVAHRDYSVAGSRIRFHIFRNRIELYVPGSLAGTLTPESMALRQSSRNELTVSLLARCPAPTAGDWGRSYLMDRRGDGVPIILDESRALAGRNPEYSLIDDSELRLVIWAAGGEPT